MAGKRRGPAPEGAAVKRAKGNSGRRPMEAAGIEDEANAALEVHDAGTSSDIQPPSWLNEDGRKVWSEVASRLRVMNILTKTDSHTFARYCSDFGRWVKLQKVLDDEGTHYEVESAHGNYKRDHPAFRQSVRLNRELLAMESNFGLNPSDRQRLFAARAEVGRTGDLFPNDGSGDGSDERSKSAIGFLQ